MALDNDARGWIMTCLSGVACVFGALFIYVDIVVRLIPRMHDFRIQDSDGFLGCSLSLSAGVMLFSALYKMLPEAKASLQEGGSSSRSAAWILILAFLGGVFGIQLFSRLIHRFMPSQAVECDHTHAQEDKDEVRSTRRSSRQSSRPRQSHPIDTHGHSKNSHTSDSEETPLLSRSGSNSGSWTPGGLERQNILPQENSTPERPSLPSRLTTQIGKLVKPRKPTCKGKRQCYGYTKPCKDDCFTNLSRRSVLRTPATHSPRPDFRRAFSTSAAKLDGANERTAHIRHHDHLDMAVQRSDFNDPDAGDLEGQTLSSRESRIENRELPDHDHDIDASNESFHSDEQQHHHHHIPTNAFLSISLQTSIAIALHKLPEGFITYATNHANPTLGVAVFLAIGIHNISEGFALALPIYLASESRIKALSLSVILGGLSQPVGAGVAAAWLKVAERGRGADADSTLSDGGYGGMFAVTAGIMASVALSLLQESFELSHKKHLCMVFAFIGMGILGVSSALTA